MEHISVLLKETVDGLDIQKGDIIVDGTLGGGGHTYEIVKRFGSDVKVIGLDLDSDAIPRAEKRLKGLKHDTIFVNSGFQDIDKVLSDLKINKVNKILLDLGLSSFQLEEAERGFTFMKDQPLLMTMQKEPKETDITASDIVNTWEEESIADIIYGFGGEKYSRKIARAIVEARSVKEIKTTFELVEVIKSAVGGFYKKLKIHPATRTFQALRIATNSELVNLQTVIEKGFHVLEKDGVMAIVSFHSLEDRIVKHEFIKLKEENKANIITKKPIIPSEEEIINNPRSRSSKLRIIKKI